FFKVGCEFLLFRINITKYITNYIAYKTGSGMGNIIANSWALPRKKPGNSLMQMTRLKRPNSSLKPFNLNSNKQNLSDTFEFGKILSIICNELDLKTCRGPLPIRIKVDKNQ